MRQFASASYNPSMHHPVHLPITLEHHLSTTMRPSSSVVQVCISGSMYLYNLARLVF